MKNATSNTVVDQTVTVNAEPMFTEEQVKEMLEQALAAMPTMGITPTPVASNGNSAAANLAVCMTGTIALFGIAAGLVLGTAAKVITGTAGVATKLQAPTESIIDSIMKTAGAVVDVATPIVGMAASTLELVATSAGSAAQQAQAELDRQLELVKAQMAAAKK